MPCDELSRSVGETFRVRNHRQSLPITAHVLREFGCGRVPPLRLLAQRHLENRAEVGRDARWNRRLFDERRLRLLVRRLSGPSKWMCVGRELVEQQAEAVDVGG